MARRNPQRPLPPGSFEERFDKGYLDPAIWSISTGTGTVGDSPTNEASMSSANVDMSYGMLRLKLSQSDLGGGVYASVGSEIHTLASYSYGTYEFVGRMSSDSGDPTVAGNNVSGTISAFFNYKTNSETEIDFELEGLDARKDNIEMTNWKWDGIYFRGHAEGTTSVTMPTHQAEDTLIAIAFNNTSNTVPTVPAGWTTVTSAAGTSGQNRAMVIAYKIAASSSETSGTWTNAGKVAVLCYYGASLQGPIGACVIQGGSSSPQTITYPALTYSETEAEEWQRPWVIRGVGIKATNTNVEAGLTSGYTLRANDATNSNEIAIFDTNGATTGDTLSSTTTSTYSGTATGWFSFSLELVTNKSQGSYYTIPGLYTGFSHYKFVWSAAGTTFYVNGVQVASHTTVKPTAAAPIFINHWGTNNANFGGVATPGTDRYMFVSYVRFIPE